MLHNLWRLLNNRASVFTREYWLHFFTSSFSFAFSSSWRCLTPRAGIWSSWAWGSSRRGGSPKSRAGGRPPRASLDVEKHAFPAKKISYRNKLNVLLFLFGMKRRPLVRSSSIKLSHRILTIFDIFKPSHRYFYVKMYVSKPGHGCPLYLVKFSGAES